MISFNAALLLVLTLGQPPVENAPQPITAQNRATFEQWTDQQIEKLLKATTVDELEPIIAELENAGVDWPTFLKRLPKNMKFPQQMLVNAWLREPGHCASQLLPGSRLRRNKKINVGDAGVCHSTFFTVTDICSYTPNEIVEQAVEIFPQGCMTIDKVKTSGTSEGLWVKDEKDRLYILVFDPPCCPEMTTSAEYIGSTITRILGYNVPRTCICTVQGTGNPLYDGRRVVATLALDNFNPGYRMGPARDRRVIRGLKVVASWINNVDQTEQNTAITKTDGGCYRHYVLDFGACLGSFTYRPQIARLGWTHLFSLRHQLAQGVYDNGKISVPWNAPYQVISPAVGYFPTDLHPDSWKTFYPNMGFRYTTEEDGKWATRRIAQFTPEQLATIIDLAQYSHEKDRDYILQTLLKRQQILIDRYLQDEIETITHEGAIRCVPTE